MELETTAWVEDNAVRWGLCEQGGGDMVAVIDSTRHNDEQEQIANTIAARSFTLFDQIEASAQIDDLDNAIRPIQDILGQDDGGVASQFFDVHESAWSCYPHQARKNLLIRYAVCELGMLEMAL